MLVDLSNGFDSVDHELLLARLNEGAVNWFENDLADRTQCVYAKNHKSSFLEITRGVPQGKWDATRQSAGDMVIYANAPSLIQAVEELQTAFKSLLTSLYCLKLI